MEAYAFTIPSFFALMGRQLQRYSRLCKARLSFFVAISSAWGYVWHTGWSALGNWSNIVQMFAFTISGFLLACAASALNQVEERFADAQMLRTRKRPLPKGELSPREARWVASTLILIGLSLMYASTFQFFVVLCALLSLILYVWGYTPLKRIGSIAVAVGAISGALPPFIGWVAAGGHPLDTQALWLFTLLFLWQFPHFWAIALLAKRDYRRAGFQLLPHPKSPTKTAIQLFLYALCLWPVALLPVYLKWTTHTSTIGINLITLYLLFQALRLIRHPTSKRAKYVMGASLLYLPIIQILTLIDKP